MMAYDHWKTTNPDDEFLGPDPSEEEEIKMEHPNLGCPGPFGTWIMGVVVDRASDGTATVVPIEFSREQAIEIAARIKAWQDAD
jgi:hypothetical protein